MWPDGCQLGASGGIHHHYLHSPSTAERSASPEQACWCMKTARRALCSWLGASRARATGLLAALTARAVTCTGDTGSPCSSSCIPQAPVSRVDTYASSLVCASGHVPGPSRGRALQGCCLQHTQRCARSRMQVGLREPAGGHRQPCTQLSWYTALIIGLLAALWCHLPRQQAA